VFDHKPRLERRRSPRIRIFGDLHGRVVQMDVLVVLRDISTGGFAIETSELFEPGVEHTVELTAPTGQQFVATATVRQCVRQLDAEDLLPYLASFVFTDAVRQKPRAIEEFIAQFDILPMPYRARPDAYRI
jgi:PilZ domain